MIAHMLAEDPLYQTVAIKDKQRFWKRILIVDDDADVTITFKAGIEQPNNNNDANKRIEVYTSNCPEVALSEFKPNFYDLLLVDINLPHMNGFEFCEKILAIDIMMPQMDGFELYEEIRKIDPKIKVCFITAFGVNYQALKAVFPTASTTDDIGCFIRKPVDVGDLIKHIEAELGQIETAL